MRQIDPGGDWRMAFDPAEFPLVVNRQSPQPDTGLHRHLFTELVIVRSGSGFHLGAEDAHPLAAGDAFVVRGRHGYADCRDLHLVNVLFDAAALAVPLAEARSLPGWEALLAAAPPRRPGAPVRRRLEPAGLARAMAIIDEMDAALRPGRPGSRFVAIAHLMRLIDLVAGAEAGGPDRCPAEAARVSAALAWMEAHHREAVPLARLARVAGVGERQFLRLFKAATGRTPMDWLIRRRLAAACDRMRAGASVTDAAMAAGFSDPTYFSRQFRRVFAMPPSRWKRG